MPASAVGPAQLLRIGAAAVSRILFDVAFHRILALDQLRVFARREAALRLPELGIAVSVVGERDALLASVHLEFSFHGARSRRAIG